MILNRKRQNPGNPYDTDDPDNYMNRDGLPEDSNLVPWMLGAMFGLAALIGLFFAQESPLTYPPLKTLTSENMPAHPSPPHQTN